MIRPLFEPGKTCWRVERAQRMAILMENDAYFRALSGAISNARRSILVLGWQFDPRTRLDPQSAFDDHQAQIGHRLRMMIKDNPDLEVQLLIWGSPLLIAASQSFFPYRAQRWFSRRLADFRLDRTRVPGACHHQKVIVIDDKLAFCGGGDVATDRWDSEEHLDHDPRRCLPGGVICKPRHEVMTMVDGAAARALGDLVRQRWLHARGEALVPVETDHDPWPETVTPDLVNVDMAIARTDAERRGAEIRENEALYLRMIADAKSLIYLENQYFTSSRITDALIARLKEPDGPEIVLMSTALSPSWFDGMTMDPARGVLIERLEAADHHDRFTAWCPLTEEGDAIIVHSKVAIIDDRVIRVGSTNLNNRSLGLDTECDVAVLSDTPESRHAIRRFRHRTLAHFVGVAPDTFAALELETGSVNAAIEALGAARTRNLSAVPPSRLGRAVAAWHLGDPVAPSDAWRPWKRPRALGAQGLVEAVS